MSAFKLQTLKQKLWAIVAASFVARVIMFFALPNTASFLAPDEGNYAFLVLRETMGRLQLTSVQLTTHGLRYGVWLDQIAPIPLKKIIR